MNSSCTHTQHVSAWFDGELSPEEADALEQHIEICPVCQEEREAIEELSGMFSVFRGERSSRDAVWDHAEVVVSRQGFRRMFSVAALVLIGLGAVFSLAPDLDQEELRFERYLERSVDQDVLEMTALGHDDFSRDRVVGLLISSSH